MTRPASVMAWPQRRPVAAGARLAWARAPVLAADGPRAFAVHPSLGNWGSSWGGNRANAHALANCERNAGQPCKLYAVDDTVVWVPE